MVTSHRRRAWGDLVVLALCGVLAAACGSITSPERSQPAEQRELRNQARIEESPQQCLIRSKNASVSCPQAHVRPRTVARNVSESSGTSGAHAAAALEDGGAPTGDPPASQCARRSFNYSNCTECAEQRHCTDTRKCFDNWTECENLSGERLAQAGPIPIKADCRQILECFPPVDMSYNCFDPPQWDLARPTLCSESCKKRIIHGLPKFGDAPDFQSRSDPEFPTGLASNFYSECNPCVTRCLNRSSDVEDAGAQPTGDCRECTRELDEVCDSCAPHLDDCARFDQLAAIEADSGVSTTSCSELLDCVLATGCARRNFLDCLCGAGSEPTTCFEKNRTLDAMPGCCKSEIASAARTTDVDILRSRASDPSYATGAVNQLLACEHTHCARACELDPVRPRR